MGLHTIALLRAEQSQTDIMAAVLDVLDEVMRGDGGLRLHRECFSLDGPPLGIADLKAFDALYVCAPYACAPHKAAQALRHDVTLTPIRILPGLKSPLSGIGPRLLDWTLVHHIAPPHADAIADIVEQAFHIAGTRPAKRLALAPHPQDGQDISAWTQAAERIGRDRHGVSCSCLSLEALTTDMILAPHTLDTIVTTAPHGGLIADIASALAGSPTVAASARLDLSQRFPPVFHPLRRYPQDGSKSGHVPPMGVFCAAAMMLEHLGEMGAARRLMAAIEQCTATPMLHAPDLWSSTGLGKITAALTTIFRRQETALSR